MIKHELSYVPALLKIFDELLVNAADNKQRDPKMTAIRVDIDANSNEISIWNDGEGIPGWRCILKRVYMYRLLFLELLTSSNYDDSEIKIIGGRNGFSARNYAIFLAKNSPWRHLHHILDVTSNRRGE
uniref:DNA topoisomerase (ATP-hydrolyzing) n=1 Tax=Ascaris suum TaxID=6253 RepID=F1L5V8_ASCSU